MIRSRYLSAAKILLSLCVLIFPLYALAFGEKIQALQASQLELGTYVIAGVVGILLVLLLMQKILGTGKVKKAKAHADLLVEQQDSLPVGILNLNLDGRIVSANGTATTLLGRAKESLFQLPLSDCFASEDKEQVVEAQREANSQVRAKARASNLYLSINFGALHTNGKEQLQTVTLNNENSLTRDVNKLGKLTEQQSAVINAMQLGEIWFDVEQETFAYNRKLAELLSLEHSFAQNDQTSFSDAQPASQLQEWVNQKDSGTWLKSLHQAKTDGHASFSCRLLANTDQQGNSYVSTYVHMIGADHNGESYQQVHICVSDYSKAGAYKQKLDTVTQHQQALLNASPDCVYAIDQNGALLWSNTAFNMLFRRVTNDSKTKNLFKVDFFPEKIKKLHQNAPSITGRSYDMDFVLTVASEDNDDFASESETFDCKLKLVFYVEKDRLSDQTSNCMVGVIKDVTEITRMQNDVEKQRAQLDKMLNLAPVAIATIDGSDKIISANSVMTRRLGYSDSDLKRTDFYELFNEAGEAGKAAKRIHQSGHLRDFHAQLKGKDKKLHPSELHVDLIDKEKQEYLCWIADRSDEQFQQDKFDSLLEHSGMPMAILGENGFSKLNNEACKFFCVNEAYDMFGIFPHSERLNKDQENALALKQIVEDVKASSKASSFTWEHKVGDLTLPCQATYVPLYKDQAFDSILCIWMDKREIQKADEARQLAINLHQAAEREIEEKQKLLASSQDQLASKTRTLADTEQQLQTVREDLTETQSEYKHLREEHQHVTQNLVQIKAQYGASRTQLAEAKKANAVLNNQLESSSEVVKDLSKQREQVENALKQSEDNYKAAQQQLAASEQNAAELKQKQDDQQQKMHALVGQIQSMKQSVTDKDAQIHQVSEQIGQLQYQLRDSSSTTDKLREQLENQRKVSEQAEQAKREIENTYQLAQAELRNKERHLGHLQSEMEKLEEMSNQEKGDMQAQQSALKNELNDKLMQLQETQRALDEAQQAAEQEKQEKAAQQALLSQVKQELHDIEASAKQKQQEMAAKEQEQKQAQQELQQKLWSELKDKQLRLQEAEQILHKAKQETESEKAEKEKHRQLFEQLQSELQEIERRNANQAEEMAASDKQWQQSKEQLKREVEAKRQQLDQTKEALDDIQRQADKERVARIEQEQKLKQLTVELSDVETRANKQKQMLEGSDEQWRKHHAEIEQQKQQLQQALAEAQQQNNQLQSKLSNKLNALQEAESQVSKTQSTEHTLQQELDKTKGKAEELQSKIAQQERKESELQRQLESHQQALDSKESSINELESKQKRLTEQLASVQREYAKSKQALVQQDDSRSELNTQMSGLENALKQSKQALADKEAALQQAQKQLKVNQSKLAEQEQALLSAHKEELQQATQQASQNSNRKPEIEKLPMPSDPAVWFDLLPYLQSQPQLDSLPVALSELIDELQGAIANTEKALDTNNTRDLLHSSKALVALSQRVNSDALGYLMASIQNDCNSGMVDNVSIRWPATKQGLEKTLRVVYSHLHA